MRALEHCHAANRISLRPPSAVQTASGLSSSGHPGGHGVPQNAALFCTAVIASKLPKTVKGKSANHRFREARCVAPAG
jgi:hypothetical protein